MLKIKMRRAVLWFGVLLLTWLWSSSSRVALISNYNVSAVHDLALLSEAVKLHPYVTSYAQSKSSIPITQLYSLRKYELRDIQFNHSWSVNELSNVDRELMDMREAPRDVFSQNPVIAIQDYQVLEIRSLKVFVVNPSQKFQICITQIFSSAKEIKRIQKRLLPICLKQSTKYPFEFNIHITEQKITVFRATIYFIVKIYYQDALVDEKIWPRQILVKVIPNYLGVNSLQIRNCSKQWSYFLITNKGNHQMNVSFSYKGIIKTKENQILADGNNKKNTEGNQNKEIILSPMKPLRLLIQPQEGYFLIESKLITGRSANCQTKECESSKSTVLPTLQVPIYCYPMVMIDYFNIGILSNSRSVLQIPISLTSYLDSNITVEEIQLKSNSQTVQLLPKYDNEVDFRNTFIGDQMNIQSSENNKNVQENSKGKEDDSYKLQKHYINSFQLLPYSKHEIICRIIIKASKLQHNKSTFDVILRYTIQQGKGQIYEARTRFVYGQLRNPISVDIKRFIDVSKLPAKKQSGKSDLIDHIFPLRNNLNIPIILERVRFDQRYFRLSWLQDKRNYIYSTQQSSQFALQYIGGRNLAISPQKHLVSLDFYGNLIVQLQVIVYDNTLQCIFQEGQRKRCSEIPDIDLGYLQTNSVANKLIQIRNWDPKAKDILFIVSEQEQAGNQQVNSNQNYQIAKKAGQEVSKKQNITRTVTVICPFLNEQSVIKQVKNKLMIHLKGHQHLVLNITVQTQNQTASGGFIIRIETQSEKIIKKISYRVEEGTFAILPQNIRIKEIYKNDVEYMNLVSTYSMPYKVKKIETNLSNIQIQLDGNTEIQPNQWVGMALFYQPFSGPNHHNFTQKCCGQKFLLTHLKNSSSSSYHKNNNTTIKKSDMVTGHLTITTTTGLSATALVSLPNKQAKILQSIDGQIILDTHNISIAVLDISHVQQSEIILKNNFEYPLKVRVKLLQKDFVEHTLNYLSFFREQTSKKVACYFCVSSLNIESMDLTAQKIKQIFRMQNNPEQLQVNQNFNGETVTLQNLNIQEEEKAFGGFSDFLERSRSKVRIMPNKKAQSPGEKSQYLLDQMMTGAKYCYKLMVTKYMASLIGTGVLNQVAQKGDWKLLSEFINHQYSNMINAHSQGALFFQPFYQKFSYNQKKLCSSVQLRFPIFKFCKHINFQISDADSSKIYNSDSNHDKKMRQQQQKLTNELKLQSQSKEKTINDEQIIKIDKGLPLNCKIYPNSKISSMNRLFYLSIANNFTKIQNHLLELIISVPKLKVENIVMDNLSIKKQQLQNRYFSQQEQIEYQQNANLLPLYILSHNLAQKTQNSMEIYEGQRIYQLKNIGDTVLKFTHIGIESSQNSCEFSGISIVNYNNEGQAQDYPRERLCNGFQIRPNQVYNLTMKFKLSFPIVFKKLNIYIYNKDRYYVKLTLKIKFDNAREDLSDANKSTLSSLILNLLSFCFISLIVWIIKQENQISGDSSILLGAKNAYRIHNNWTVPFFNYKKQSWLIQELNFSIIHNICSLERGQAKRRASLQLCLIKRQQL